MLTDVAAQAKQQFSGYTGMTLIGITSDDRILWSAYNARGAQRDRELFQWRRGTITDLGALPKGMTPKVFNSKGDVAGSDYFAPSFAGGPPTGYRPPPVHAYLWRNAKITGLGTLGEVGQVEGINDRDQIVEDGVPKGTKWPARALLWQNGRVVNISAYPGDETFPAAINNRGDVLGGVSLHNKSVGFLWRNGKTVEIGSAADAFEPVALNDSDVVVGLWEKPAWDRGPVPYHAFVWQNGRLTDLGRTGNDSQPAVNDRGQVIDTNAPDQLRERAVLWQNGRATDLGSLGGPRTVPLAIDDHGDVVGVGSLRGSTDDSPDLRAFVWRNGKMTQLPGPPVDGFDGPMAIDVFGTHITLGTFGGCTATSCAGSLLLWTYSR